MRLRWFLPVVLVLMAIGLVLNAGCEAETSTGTPYSTTVSTIHVSLLIQLSEDDIRWFRDVEIPNDTNAYEIVERVTEGDLEATYYPAFFSHFVEAMLGVANEGTYYWLTFLWNANQEQWEPLPVGADLFSLKDGHVLAWSYTDTSLEPSQLPSVTP
jgi:hypothetical protein